MDKELIHSEASKFQVQKIQSIEFSKLSQFTEYCKPEKCGNFTLLDNYFYIGIECANAVLKQTGRIAETYQSCDQVSDCSLIPNTKIRYGEGT